MILCFINILLTVFHEKESTILQKDSNYNVQPSKNLIYIKILYKIREKKRYVLTFF